MAITGPPPPPHPVIAKTTSIAPASPILFRNRRAAYATAIRARPISTKTIWPDGGGACSGAEGTKLIEATVTGSLIGFMPSGVTEECMGVQVELAGAPVQVMVTA